MKRLHRLMAMVRVHSSALLLPMMALRNHPYTGRPITSGRPPALLRLLRQRWFTWSAWAMLAAMAVASGLQHNQSRFINTVMVFITLTVIRNTFVFFDDLEPTSRSEQQAWVENQLPRVQERYARCHQPLQKEAWAALHKLAESLDDQARLLALHRAETLEASLPSSTSDSTPRRF